MKLHQSVYPALPDIYWLPNICV